MAMHRDFSDDNVKALALIVRELIRFHMSLTDGDKQYHRYAELERMASGVEKILRGPDNNQLLETENQHQDEEHDG